MSNFTPQFVNPSESDHIILARILDAISLGSQANVSSGGNAFDVNIVPSTGNGFTGAKTNTSTGAVATNIFQVKASAGLIGTIYINNTIGTGSDFFVSFFDTAAISQTGGTVDQTPYFVLRTRINSQATIPLIPSGLNFASGIAFAITTSIAGKALASTGASGIDVTVTYL